MSEWRSGEFERERVSTVLRNFAPAHAVENLESISLEDLHADGKRLILLDVDNTLVAWKQEDFSEPVLDWLARAKALGFDICIISNTRRVQRLGRIKDFLGVEVVRGRFKPSRAMYRLALLKFGRKKQEAVMIGDQMMTDILGANRAGIDAIWCRRIAPKEFGPTRINRFMEGLLTSVVYKALILPEDASRMSQLNPATQSELKLTQQVLRFLIVGGTSFAIDAGLFLLFMKWQGPQLGSALINAMPGLFHWAAKPSIAAAPIFGGISSLVAMYNSYVWNRAWTFQAQGKGRKSTQMTRFFAISIMGTIINDVISTLVLNGLPGHRELLAKAIAAAVVAVWNFIGQRQFAFKGKEA